jgi:phage FluMu protein Com
MRTRRGWLRCDHCRAILPTLDATVTPIAVLCPTCAALTTEGERSAAVARSPAPLDPAPRRRSTRAG